MYKLSFIIAGVFFLSCNQPHYTNPHVLINTQLGDIEVELFPQQAPETVAAFLSYIDSGFYTHASFYRVLKTEELPTETNTGIIQGGIWSQSPAGQTNPDKKIPIPGIEHETTKQTGLTHQSGTVSLARTAPGTANTEFFICIGNQTLLDYGQSGSEDSLGYAAFGKVFTGMPIVRKIQAQSSHADKFDTRIEIRKITRL